MPSPTCATSTRRVLDLAAAQSADIAARLARSACACSPARAGSPAATRASPRPPTADAGARRRRRARRHRRHPAGHGHRAPRRRAHPHLAADLRPRRAARARSSSSGRASPAPSSPRPTSASARRSCSSPPATGCCPARTPTPPRSSRTSSRKRGMEVLGTLPGGVRRAHRRRRRRHARRRPRRRRARTPCWPSARCRNTAGLGLEEVGVELTPSGHIAGRPGLAHHRSAASTPPATAPGCCRSRPWRPCRAASRCRTPSATPWRRSTCAAVAANIFTDPEIATVGVSSRTSTTSRADVESVMLPLARNPRAKMQGITRRLRQALLPQGLRHRASAASSSRPRRPS